MRSIPNPSPETCPKCNSNRIHMKFPITFFCHSELVQGGIRRTDKCKMLEAEKKLQDVLGVVSLWLNVHKHSDTALSITIDGKERLLTATDTHEGQYVYPVFKEHLEWMEEVRKDLFGTKEKADA